MHIEIRNLAKFKMERFQYKNSFMERYCATGLLNAFSFESKYITCVFGR